MGRKQTLYTEMMRHLEHDNQGSSKTRKRRVTVMIKIVSDLMTIRQMPASWFALTRQHIVELIALWQKHGLKNGSIINYLIPLRYFLKKIEHAIDDINNQALGLDKIKNHIQPISCADSILTQMDSPLVQVLLGMQTEFGLTFSETIKITPYIHIQNNELWITREISTNHRDRVIPIHTPQQHAFLEQLKALSGEQKNLLRVLGYTTLRNTYNASLKKLGLPSKIGYRYLYAKKRYAALCKTHSKSFARKTLIHEMNINNTSPIWRTMHE